MLMKRELGFVLVTAMYLTVPVIGQQKVRPISLSEVTGNAPEETKKAILKLEEEHSMAVWNHDTATLNGLLADNWAYTNERGEVLSKEQWINNIKIQKFGMDTIIHDDIRIDEFGDTVVVMGRSTSTLHYTNNPTGAKDRADQPTFRVGGHHWRSSENCERVSGQGSSHQFQLCRTTPTSEARLWDENLATGLCVL
jgi:hypothetical protein